MMGRDGSGNVLAPNLTLKLNLLLQNFPQSQRKDELMQVTFLILRHISNLRHVYHFYCTLGHNRVQSTKSEMTRLQFWRFVKDSHIHHHGLSLPEMDRIIAKCLEKGSVHQPTERLSLSDFLSSITVLSYVIYKDKIKLPSKSNNKLIKDKPQPSSSSSKYFLPQCLQMLITDHIMKYSGHVKGGFLYDPRRAINALAYMEGSWKVYKSLCDQQSREPTLIMRKLLHALNDLKIIGPHLSTETVLKILAADNPNVQEGGTYNLEIEITFLEYFEALVGCAVKFVSKDMIQQSTNLAAMGMQRNFSERRASGGSGLGHSRPGSAYSRHTSARSSRTVSSQRSTASSISSIVEDTDTVNMEDQSSVRQDDQATNEQAMETAISGIDQLHMDDSGQQTDRTEHASGQNPVFSFDDIDEEDGSEGSSMMSPRSSPEITHAEIHEKETQFITWSSQLNIFFKRHLFPAWQKLEMLRREAAKHRGRQGVS